MAMLPTSKVDNTVANVANQALSPVMNVIRQLGIVVNAGQRLAETLPSVQTAIVKIQEEQRQMEEAVDSNENTDPEVAVEISTLKRSFQSCINDAKHFLKACVDMALYAVDEEIQEGINQDLEQGKLDVLAAFVGVFATRVEECKKRLKYFQESQTNARESAQVAMDKYKKKYNSSGREVQTMRRNHSHAHLQVNMASGTQYVSALAICGGLVAANRGWWSPRTALLAGIVGGVAILGTWMYEHKAAGDGLQAKQDLTENMKERSIFEGASKSIKDLQKSMDEVVVIIDEMSRHVEQASNEIKGEHSLKKYVGPPQMPPTNIAHYRDIEQKLKSLRRSMNSILQELEDDGTRISRNPDEIISNTQPTQSTLDTETEPNYGRTLDLCITNGSSVASPQAPISTEDINKLPEPVQVQDTVAHSVQDTNGVQEQNTAQVGIAYNSVQMPSPTQSLRSEESKEDEETKPDNE